MAMLPGAVAAATAGCDVSARCGSDTVEVDGACVSRSDLCPRGTVEHDGECIPDGSVVCGTGTTFNVETGMCDPDITGCATGTVLVEGECVPEDEVRMGDVLEGPEPNDGPPDRFASFDLPAVGEDILIQGCIDPYRDVEEDGEEDPDLDAFVFETLGPALLDITVDGVGGAAGGFHLIALDGAPARDEWERFGINLSSDTTRQQAFVPAAGTYALLVTDSRSALTGLAAGGPGACYFATIANAPIPSPTPLAEGRGRGSLGGTVQFWSYAPETDGGVIRNAVAYTGRAAAAGLVQMVNGEYRGSTRYVDLGIQAEADLGSLTTDDRVVLVVEPIANFSLRPVQTTLIVTPISTARIATDGAPTTLVHEDASPLDFGFFQGRAGDMVRLQFNPGAVSYDITLYPPRATSFDVFGEQWISRVCSGCQGAVDSWIQLRETGYYYLTISNRTADDGEAYQVRFTITPDRPPVLSPGTSAPGALAGGRAFFEATFADQTWLDFRVDAAGFANARVRFYDRTAAGELDEIVPALDQGVSSGGAPFGRVVAGREGAFLVSVENADSPGGSERFDLLMASKPFVDGGVVVDGSPVVLNDIALAAGQPAFVFLRGGAGDSVRVNAIDDGGIADLVLEQLDRSETVLLARDRGGAGAAETLARVLDEEAFLALRVSAVGGGAGRFDLDGAVVDLPRSVGAREPSRAIPDGDPIGLNDTVNLANPCSVAFVMIDVNITHPFRGDIRLTVTGPSGTSVRLKQRDNNDSRDNLVGTFPTTLESSGSLDAFLGEEGGGNWTLNVADLALQDMGKLIDWGVTLLCM